MKYAVIQTGGKQYRVSEGDVIEVERLASKPSENITFSDVLLFVADDTVKVGTPHVPGMSVSAEVISDIKGEKIRVAKFKAKARYRRTTGHRQSLSQIKISQIGDKKEKKEAVAVNPVVKAEKPTRVVKKKAV